MQDWTDEKVLLAAKMVDERITRCVGSVHCYLTAADVDHHAQLNKEVIRRGLRYVTANDTWFPA